LTAELKSHYSTGSKSVWTILERPHTYEAHHTSKIALAKLPLNMW
jgi:hypothetical protein